jgi:4-amino-4-deoxy-L-arabinose transferase-like glycosyltransferase
MRPIFMRLSKLDLERIWVIWAAFAVLWSVFGVVLAQIGEFRPLLVGVATVLAGLGGWFFGRIERRVRGTERSEGLWPLTPILIAAGLLFGWPAEHFPLLGDSAIYPNTAAVLIRTGGLSDTYRPFTGLTLAQKELFYVPSDRQIPGLTIHSYKGLLYGAYYVMDPERNWVVSSRQPVPIVWMGALGMIGGPLGMLYATPLLGVTSLAALYFVGKWIFGRREGALAALWLLLSFPQLHFSRAPYAEVFGQFFVLAGLYGLTRFLQTGWMGYAGLGIMAWGVAFAARLEMIMALPILVLFLVCAVRRYGGRALVRLSPVLMLALAFAAWSLNRPYAGATLELIWAGVLHPLWQKANKPVVWIGLLGAGLLAAVGLGWALRKDLPGRFRQSLRWGGTGLMVAGVIYGMLVRPWIEGFGSVPTHAELLPIASLYISPLLLGSATVGAIRILHQSQGRPGQRIAFGALILFGLVFFWRYTTARVYPVALRRLVPEVLPLLALTGAWGLSWPGNRWKWVGRSVAGLICIWLIGISGPYWMEAEGQGTWKFMERMVSQIPQDAVILFEPLDDNSIVGWFAAPLWSFYNLNALLLNNNFDKNELENLIKSWQALGKHVYVLVQGDSCLEKPGLFVKDSTGELWWNSNIIGQSLKFPPIIWRFKFSFVVCNITK